MKMTKRVFSALAALTLAVAAIPAITVQAAPNVIVSYDFENGLSGMSDTGLGSVPTIVQDAEKGNVLQFNGGTGSSYLVGATDAGSKNSTKIDPGTPSSVKLDSNPFAGKNLTGATIAMWVKAPEAAAESGAGLVGFISKHYEGLKHPDAIYDNNTTTESISGEYCYGIGAGAYDEARLTSAMVYFGGFLGNTMWIQDWEKYFINNPDKWVYMVVTLGNDALDNKVYIDGNLLCEAGAEYGNTISKRFNHGQAGTSDTEANKHEPLMFEVLTASDTTAYLGYTGSMAAADGVCIDDVTYYDSIASAADVMSMYEAAKANMGSSSANTDNTTSDNTTNNNDANTNNNNTTTNNTTNTKSGAGSSTPNLPQTGVVSTGLLVACGTVIAAGGAVLFKKRENDK